ncbi:CENP-Q, a CENPA-CAD centromere complex subunit-domain-containing protein [Lasiosphaeria miniovina]|uniref:CENP-Q, a CENPA-CAD centromere complex subunit-domain-containing protein n=1 Tax=Lasiosphaeria miniovina TaxID=1954250 RepID=A0AA40DM69_9PEZI|nr:CENP-Q, a CENPA-CAD centromere complex subunit-domain-containing protein [Lasiosphaeria miniovina]KAK0706371.1 CENP-Q, a CENPA-CAD centromere complex subunit-domain-containing protein [Lasiosphaeria miniovina]
MSRPDATTELRKRGRPRKSLDVVAPPEEEPAPVAKRTRRVAEPEPEPEPEPETPVTAPEAPMAKKRGRLRKNAENDAEHDQPPSDPRPRKRIKQSATANQATEQTFPDNPQLKTHERTRAVVDKGRDEPETSPWWAPNTSEASPDASRRGGQESNSSSKNLGRDRSSLGDVAVTQAQNRFPAQPRGPQRKTKTKTTEPALVTSAQPSSTSKGAAKVSKKTLETVGERKRRPGQPAEKDTKESGNPDAQTRRPSRDQEAGPTTRGTAAPKFRQLTSRTRQIPRSTISAKWTTLDQPSIAAVDSIISDASRPVLLQLRGRENRQEQAQTILELFASRLHHKLVKGFPFPPPTLPSGGGGGRNSNAAGTGGGSGGHSPELDFERTVHAIQAAEKMLDPLLHSVALLTAEKEREEAALEREYKALRALETNAKTEARGWRDRAKRDHVLAPERQRVLDGEGAPAREPDEALEMIVKKAEDSLGSGVFKDIGEDAELLALSKQISNHMESMKDNLQQIDGIVPAIAKSKAALQGVLQQHLDPQQYNRVVLG